MCIARGGLAAMWADERPSSPGTLHVGPDTCELTPGTLYIGPCSWVPSIPFGATFLDSFELLPIHFDSVRFFDMGRGGREGERGGGVAISSIRFSNRHFVDQVNSFCICINLWLWCGLLRHGIII